MPKVNREIIQQSSVSAYFAGFGQWHILSAKSKQILYIAKLRSSKYLTL
jgi:hypothetical protein